MPERFVTSDIITYVLAYIGQATEALRGECGLGVLEYRMLAFLADHPDGTDPLPLARILSASPASVSLAAGKLAGRGLVVQGGPGRKPRHLTISKTGIDASRDADIVLAAAHDAYFSPLPPNLKAAVDIGSIVTNQSSPEARHIRDGHFFTAFETLHAFLTVERLLTLSTHRHALSLTQFRMLFEADRQGGIATPGALADALLLAPSTVSYALGGLAARGLITSKDSPKDRRSQKISATDEGSGVFADALADVEAVFTTDIRASSRSERAAYKDAAMIMVSHLRKRR